MFEMGSRRDCCSSKGCSCRNRPQELAACEEELELKRQKAHEDRIREQELVKEEFSRLEDILKMCAEYEKMMESSDNYRMRGFSFDSDILSKKSGDHESGSLPRSPSDGKSLDKPPPSPGHTVQQNRIKTNGSLSRGSPCSRSPTLEQPLPLRRQTSSDDELQETQPSSPEKTPKNPNENVGSILQTPPSPRTRIRTIAGLREDGKKSPQSSTCVQSHVSPHVSPGAECSSQLQCQSGRRKSWERSVSSGSASQGGNDSEQRQSILFSLTRIKDRISEIERQITEAVSGVEMERALLSSELESHRKKLREDELLLVSLYEKQAKFDCGLEQWRKSEDEKVASSRRNLELMEAILDRLERGHESFCGSEEEETQLLDKLKQQHELLEHERKAFEDQEFRHMEAATTKEAEREDLLHEITAVEGRLGQRRQQIRLIQTQILSSLREARKDVDVLVQRRRSLSRELDQEKQQLALVDSSQKSSVERGSSQSTSLDYSDGDDRNIMPRVNPTNHVTEIRRYYAYHARSVRLSIDTRFVQRSFSPILRELDNLELAAQSALTDPSPATSQFFEEVLSRTRKPPAEKEDSRTPSFQSGSCQSSPEFSLDNGSKEIRPSSLSIVSLDNSCPSPSLESPSSSSKDTSEDSSSDGRVRYNVSFNPSEIKKRERSGNMNSSMSKQRPLTRYLPVRNDDFDLRVHIETAGHQLELCPHITVTSTSARGYLFKCGQRIRKWQKRWFVFDRMQRTFLYYADKSEHKSRGGMYFQEVEEVYVDHLNSSKSPHPKLTFCVKTPERIFSLMAPSAEAMRIWVDVIFTGAEAYNEY